MFRVALLLLAVVHPALAVCGRTCASSPGGCGKGFGTLAYVVTTCQVVGTGKQIGSQELRVQRAGCDPVTVMRFANPEPVADPAGLCALLGVNHLGTASPVAGLFQRIGVSHDGKAVVFEVSNTFQLVGRTPLAPEEQGFFYIRADGSGLRRLGPPSRDPTYRIFVLAGAGPSAEVTTRIAFSDDDRMIAFTDLAPGPDGVETEQIFATELGTGARRQVTRLMAGAPPTPGARIIGSLWFFRRRIIGFIHQTGDDAEVLLIGLDGTGLRPAGSPLSVHLGGDGRIIPAFRRSGLSYYVGLVEYPGLPANAAELPGYPIAADLVSVFVSVFSNGQLIQLTNFHYGDTTPLGLRSDSVIFMASADPLGANPFHNCELFRVSPLGLGLRQVTHFGQGRRSEEGCQIGPLAGCGIRPVNEDPGEASPALTFYSDCDPFGANPNGSQVFAVRWNGARLRQLTRTRGVTTAPDGSVVEVEIPGPVARGGSR